jgi:hypothetical protein
MINIIIFNPKYVEIENDCYPLDNEEDLQKFIIALVDKIKYGGEKLSLETAKVDSERGVNLYTLVKQW